MTTKYLELDSTYRDRTKWPEPAQFEVQISQSGVKNKDNAIDPVCLSAPVNVWKGNMFRTGGGSTVLVSNAGTTATIGAGSAGLKIYVKPNTGALQPIENYYAGAVISRSVAIDDFKRIVGYKAIAVDASGVVTNAMFEVDTDLYVGWGSGTVFTISDPTDFVDTTSPYIFVPAGRDGDNAYYGSYIYNQTVRQYRAITSYDGDTHIAQVQSSGTAATGSGIVTGWSASDVFCIRKEIPLFTGTATITGASPTSVVLSATGASTVDNAYKNFFLREYSNSTGASVNEMRRITAYDGDSKVATVHPAFGGAYEGLPIEALQFSYDNVTPFSYTSGFIGQQEEVCYELELLDLVLPNIALQSGYGSLTAFYPYLYVELRNVTGGSAGNSNILCSNNPNANKMLFRVSVDDKADPLEQSFITLKSSAVQTIKFKANDSMRFGVYLPDGSVFSTIRSDYDSPLPPNSVVQISANFSLKRVI